MVYSGSMTTHTEPSEYSKITPTEEAICDLVDRLRATGHHLDEETNVIEARIPNFHDCHVAADVIESLLIFKKMSQMVLAHVIEKVESNE